MASISIVITTHNRAALLKETLAALRTQRYQPGDELIVVDNASTDDTPDVVHRNAVDFPISLRYLREVTPGKSAALNTGIAAARGEILALTDDDVLVADDWIAMIRRTFEDNTLVLAGGRVDPRWERPAPAWMGLQPDSIYGVMASPLALLHYGEAQPLANRTAVGANLVVRRSAVQALGGFAPNLGRRSGTLLCGEDHDFCQRAVAAGYRCEYRPELRVQHWVPAERVRLRYYLRWFYWSGITNAVLERQGAGTRGRLPRVPRYIWRQLALSPVFTVAGLLRRDLPKAAERAMEGAYAIGFIRQRVSDWVSGSRGARRSRPVRQQQRIRGTSKQADGAGGEAPVAASRKLRSLETELEKP